MTVEETATESAAQAQTSHLADPFAGHLAASRTRTVVVARATVHLGAHGKRTVVLKLTATGRRLLARRRSLPVVLTVLARGVPVRTRTLRLR